jgi:uncharacterized membrane protein required for colicin V production
VCAVADAVLLVVFGLAFVVGAWRGALRQLLVAGAWLVSFLAAAYLRDQVANWLSPQQPELSWQYTQMLSFLLVFGAMFGVLALIIEVTGTRMTLSRRQWVDDWLGGLLGVIVAILVVGSLMIIFDSYYTGGYPTSLEIYLVQVIHSGLMDSNIGQALHASLVPGLLAVGGLLLPANVVHPG